MRSSSKFMTSEESASHPTSLWCWRASGTSPPGGNQVDGLPPAPVVRSTPPNIFDSGTPLGLRGTFNKLEDGKVSFFRNRNENYSESNESRNIHFDLRSHHEFCAILSWNQLRDDPEQVGWNSPTTYQENWKIAFTIKNRSNDASRWIRHVKNI